MDLGLRVTFAQQFRADSGASSYKAARTIQRLKDGHDHITADPVHGVTRKAAAYMLANADELLKEINRHE